VEVDYFVVRARDRDLGHAVILFFDAKSGLVQGIFNPEPAYEKVRETFLLRLWADTNPDGSRHAVDEAMLARYERELEVLGLRLLDQAGRELAVSEIVLTDLSPLSGHADTCFLDAWVSDAEYWRRRAAGQPPPRRLTTR
jgi:hypothetical protein